MTRRSVWTAASVGLLLIAAWAYGSADRKPSISTAEDRDTSNAGEELRILQRRLDSLEREQKATDSRTPLRASAQPAPIPVATAEVQPLSEQEVVDQEEEGRLWLARYLALSEVIDEEVETGSRDEWAVDAEAAIATTLAESFPQSSLKEVVCSQSACRFEASHEDPQTRAKAIDDLPYEIEEYFDELRHELSESPNGEKIVTWRMVRKGSAEELSRESEKRFIDQASI